MAHEIEETYPAAGANTYALTVEEAFDELKDAYYYLAEISRDIASQEADRVELVQRYKQQVAVAGETLVALLEALDRES